MFLAPAVFARSAGMDCNRGAIRAMGLADLAPGGRLFVGRPQSRWMTLGGATNPTMAAVVTANGRSIRARLLAGSLVALTAVDLYTAARLRAAGD